MFTKMPKGSLQRSPISAFSSGPMKTFKTGADYNRKMGK